MHAHAHTVFCMLCPHQEPWSIEKVMEIDDHLGCAMSGLVADAKMLVDHARAETQVRYGKHAVHECMRGPVLTRALSYAHSNIASRTTSPCRSSP